MTRPQRAEHWEQRKVARTELVAGVCWEHCGRIPNERTTIIPPRKLASLESVGRSYIGELRPSKGIWQACPPVMMRDSLLASGFFHGD